MNITHVGIKMINGGTDRLKAFCTMTIDEDFVVRDLKVVDGPHGLFVAMPSRKRTMRCGRCGHRNEVRSHYCNDCGAEMPPFRPDHADGRNSDHTDIAHPINSECREMIQQMVLEAYDAEVEAIRRSEEEARAAAASAAAHTVAAHSATHSAMGQPVTAMPPGRAAQATAPAPPAPVLDDNEAFGAGIG